MSTPAETKFDRRMIEALVCPVTQTQLTYDADKQELLVESRQSGLPDPWRHPGDAGG